jgi:RNA polymerase sigma-70 factor (ECF subfamily)
MKPPVDERASAQIGPIHAGAGGLKAILEFEPKSMDDKDNPSATAGASPAWLSVEIARAQIPLYAYVRNLMGGSADAWDVLQDANRVICEKAANVKSPAEFLPWAYTVARYEVLHYRQRAARERLVFSPEVIELLADEGSAVCGDFADRTVALETCFKKLPERQQQYVRLHYTDELGVGEIARRFERGENAIAAALYRARVALARCIEATLALGGSR